MYSQPYYRHPSLSKVYVLYRGTFVCSTFLISNLCVSCSSELYLLSIIVSMNPKKYKVKNSEGDVVLSASLKNAFSILTVASEEIIAEDTYTLWLEDAELAAGFSGPLEMFGPGMKGGHLPMPEGMKPPKNRS